MSNDINRVAVFSKAQRITHWLIAGAITFLLISAWLVQHADVDVIAWLDWHIMIGQALSLVLAYRIYLLFVSGSGHWRLLIPTKEQRHVYIQTVKFYASLGKLPCPDWYAFNPVWQPIYLLLIIIMILTTITGFLTGNYLFLAGFTMPELHSALARIILYFTLAHIFFAVYHDIKGGGAQISAMLNGFKYFQIKEVESPIKDNSVSLDSLLKK